MANKKITVVGDGVEEPLTPEEEHRIEVKVDQMLDPSVPEPTPAAEPAADKPEVVPTAAPALDKADAAPTVTSAPKVTKIVTKFADEPEIEKPVEAPKVAPVVEEKPKPVVKKITVRHHDDEAEKPEKPEAPKSTPKAAKKKAAPKKSTKKPGATETEGSKPDDLAEKADAIAASALAAEESMVAKQPTEESEPVAAVAAGPAELEAAPEPADEPEDLVETTNDEGDGAPPLILKHAAAPIGVTPSAEAQTPVEGEEEVPAQDEPDTPDPDTETPPVAPKTEITVEEPEEPAENIEVEVEASTEAPEPAGQQPADGEEAGAPTEDTKKYRPPDGPIQFKRAEVPIQPHKPGEPRAEEPSSAEISEDAALAQAFEPTTKPSRKSDTARRFGAGLGKVLKWAIILAILGGVATVAATPSLRTKALNLVGLDKAKPTASSSKPSSSTASTTAAPASPDIYIAKRAGVNNIYKIAPGGQEQLVLPDTGKVEDGLALAPNAANTFVALVSSRDGTKDSSGTLQQSLVLVNVADGSISAVDNTDEVKLVDWFGNRIVYVLLNTGTSTSDTNRYQLVSYDVTKKVRTVLDHASYLNDVMAAKGSVYYATATSSSGSGQFVKILPDGSGKRVVLSAEVAAISRASYGSLVLSGVSKWYSYELDAQQATVTNNVSQDVHRLYIDSPNAKRSAYIDPSGTLISTDTSTGKETKLPATAASYPIHWLNGDTIAYRSGNSDYSVKVSGGQPTKITDVFDAAGISLWHDL